MRLPIFALAAVLTAFGAEAQQSAITAPPPNEPEAHPIPSLSSEKNTVMITPDPSATSMADPQSAAIYGSPTAVEPGSPMPNAMAWPTPQPSAKRPKWLQKAPPPPPAQSPTQPH
jgi:hypothetical protein